MSFRLKTILGIALIELLLLSLLLWSGLGYMLNSAETEFRQRTEATTRAYAVAARNSLISSDLAELDSLTREMLQYPGVTYARVRNDRGQVLAEAGPPEALQRSPMATPRALRELADGILDTSELISESGTSFGRVELGVSAIDLQKRLAEARRNGIGLAALEMVLVALFSWLLGAYLTRQLRDLSQAAAKLAEGALGLQIPVTGRDELGATAQAFNHMSTSLAKSYAELALREQELRLRGKLIDATQVGMVIADATRPDLPVIDVNPAFERITGYTREEARDRNCRFLQGPLTDAQALQRIRDAVAGGREVAELVLNYRRDGTTFWNELQIMPIRDDADRVTHFVALQSDVTARVEAQQALAAREAYLREVLNATHDGILVIDAEGMVESFNAGAEAMFGQTAGQIIGHHVAQVVPPPLQDDLRRFLADLLAQTGDARMSDEREFETRRQDGRSLWIALRIAELPLGGPRRYIGVVHDITARKLGEMELRAAKEAAEGAAAAKSEFLANMSHEIRTPMHGVLGSIEMLRDTPLNAQQRRHVDTAGGSATLLLSVIDEILDFSRLEAGKLRIESLEYDPRRTVEDVTAMLAARAHAKRIELACYIAPEVPDMMRGDPIRLRQVLVNLVGNAIKFTDSGEVVVSVTLTQDGEAGPTLRFEVRDTGIGIAADKREHLFQPFSQADSSTSRRFGGTGLGLSISRRLVELMDGQIGLTSQEGKGSTFWFQLPAMTADKADRGARPTDFAGTNVLVVDDNATNRIILHRYLTAWGGQSSSAANGEEALAKLQDAAIAGRPYDLALLDLNMPGMDGYTLLARIHSDPVLASMPLIMLSSSTQEPARMAGLRVDVWLDKPVRQSDLHDAVATVLARPRLSPPSTAPSTPSRLQQFAGERVLLVEDNAITGELGLQMLRKRGLTVDLAVDGRAAVEAVTQGGPYEVVLMDIQMPGLDGYQATRAIRAWEAQGGRPRLPIIALTAHALPADRERCLAAGMDDHTTKPFSGETIGTVVARWLAPPGQVGRAMPPSAVPAVTVLDAARLAEVRAAMGTLMPELLVKVRDALDEQQALMTKARAGGDAAAIGDVVHRIKNTAGDIGATRLHGLAAALEREGSDRMPAAEMLDLLAPALTETLAALGQAIEMQT